MYSNDKFREKLSMENIRNTSNGLEKFLQIIIGILGNLAPQKKYVRGNNMPFMNKTLTHAP